MFPQHPHQPQLFPEGHPKRDLVNKPFIVIAVGTFLGAGLGSGYMFQQATSTPAPATYVATPAYLVVPKLNLTTQVEQVSLDEQGNMGAPTDIMAVGWYSLGPRPGEKGNAVIDGHFNTPDLTPGIFSLLHTLIIGDEIKVVDHYGQEITFTVSTIRLEPYSDFPIEKYFGPANSSKLHLITCQGIFDRELNTFNQRTVVSADMVAISSIQ
jgi:sortase A